MEEFPYGIKLRLDKDSPQSMIDFVPKACGSLKL
jgi:hypothetical protein